MSKKAGYIERLNKRRLRTSYFSVVVSMGLVLFTMGLLGIIVFNAKRIADHVKENFTAMVLIKPEVKEVELRQFQKELELEPYIKSTEYISKEEAAEMLKKDLDEDFLEFLGYNPLSNSIEVHFHADYATEQVLEDFSLKAHQNKIVDEVVYDKPLIQLMNDNIQKLSLGILALSTLLALVAIALINSSIRLSIYARRFTINTMQLVGATRTFIRKPFLMRSMQLGFIGALIAIIFLITLLYFANKNFPELMLFADLKTLGIIALGISFTGVFLSWLFTFLAVRKYLNLRTEDLYF